jgi:rubrerythrin
MSTIDNLKEAFAGESQANRRYLAFAKKADDEGHHGIAKLFRAAAHSETIHALSHLNVMGEVASTAENLSAAIDGETYEFESMYPGFISEAEKDGNNKAAMSFGNANAVEQIHAGFFKKALEGLDKDQAVEYYVCPVCGNVFEGSVPDRCPICATPKSKFETIK